MADKLDDLFADLQSRGFAQDKTNADFRSYMLAPGKQGYENRKTFFEDFKSQGLTGLNSYEEFASLIGLKGRPQQPSVKPQMSAAGETAPVVQKSQPQAPTMPQLVKEGLEKGSYNSRPVPVRQAGDPGVAQFGVPYRPDTQLTAAQRDEIYRQNDFALRQMKKMQREQVRRGQPMVDTGIPSVNSSVIKTQGQWDEELQKGAGRISSSVVVPAVDKAIAEFDKRAHEVFEASRGQSGGLPTGTAGGAGIFGAVRESNEAKDPDKILAYLSKQMEGLYHDKAFMQQISDEAGRMGLDSADYVENVIKPRIASDIRSRFDETMIAREMPKSGKEYVVNGLSNSIIGMLADAFLETKGQRAYKNQAEAMTEEGRNPYYNPGTGARLTKIGVSFAADAPFFGVYGKVSGQVAKNIAEREIRNLVGKGLSETAARSVVGTALENSVGTRMKNYLMQHIVSSSLTMGGYNATSEIARQTRDKEGYDVGGILGSTAEGLAVGGAFGATGAVTQALSQPLTGFARLGAKAAGFGAEAETMYATEELTKMLHGEDAFDNPFEGSVEALEKLGVMKLSGGHLLKSAGDKIKRAREVGAMQTAEETLAGILGKTRTGVSLSDATKDYIRNTSEGSSLMESLSQMHPDRAVSEVNGKKQFTEEGEALRMQLARNYDAFMSNKDIPSTSKAELAQVFGGIYRPGLETGADIIQNEDGSVLVKTRDKDGNCIQDIKFDNLADAEQWRESHQSQCQRNDAVNMWNAASPEARQEIVDAIREQVSGEKEIAAMLERAGGMRQNRMKRELEKVNETVSKFEGRALSDEEARNYIQMVIKDGDDAVFGEIYQLIHDKAYPADVPDIARHYWEGQQLSPMDRHFALVDAQVAEERLMLQGQDYAEEVMSAADYPDEKIAELAASLSRGGITKEQFDAAVDYYNKTSKVSGMYDEAIRSVDNQVEAANAYVRQNTHTDSGSMISVTSAERPDAEYYLTAGHIEMGPDGDVRSTDGSGMVILRDKVSGEIIVTSPDQVRVDRIDDPNRIIAGNESMDGLRGQLMQQADAQIDLHPDVPEAPQEAGETFVGEDGKTYMVNPVPDENGNTVWTKVELELDENGNMTGIKGQPQELDINEYRKARSNEIDAAERPQEEMVAPVVEDDVEPVRESEPVAADNIPETPAGGEAGAEDGTGVYEPSAGVSSRIPTDEKGRKIYEQARPEDTLAELTEKYGEEKARQMIGTMAANVAAEYEKLSQKDVSKFTEMADLDAHEEALSNVRAKMDYWNNLLKATEPAQELPKEEATAAEPQPAAEPPKEETPVAEMQPEEKVMEEQAMEVTEPVTEPEAKTDIPVSEETQPALPTAEQKVAQGTIKQNVGKRFAFQNEDGTRSEVVIDAFKGDDQVEVTRQDYYASGALRGEAYKQDLGMVDVGNSIINGTLQPVLSVEERLRNAYKGKPGMQNVIDVLTDEERRNMLSAVERGDQEALREMTNEYVESHREDIILNERDKRNAAVSRIMDGGGSREEKLRRVRKEYQGYDDAVIALSDEAMRPTTLEEYVSDLHSRQPKSGEGPLAYFSYDVDGNKIVGMQDESGHGTKTGGDTKGYAPWLAPKGKGMSLQRYAETVHEQLPEAVKEQYSDQDVRNAILSVFGGAERPSDITTMTLRRGILQAEQAARRMEEQWIDGPSYQKAVEGTSFAARLQRAVGDVNTEPTEGQKEAGNYKKGHMSFGGYDYTIENPAGSVRRGKDAAGREWEQKMNNTYGYILGKYGKDGDHLDMFINDGQDLDNWNGTVYVVDQVDPRTGKFDEHKVMYGFDSLDEAKQAYLSNYEEGWQGLGKIVGVTKEGFDKWLDSSKRKMKEFAEHSIAKEHMVESEHQGFDSALKQLNTRGISINDPELMKEYGLTDLTLSKTGDHVTLNKIVVENKGQGNGTRFMEDLARLADEKGWTLALTPSGSFGAKSIRRLKDFYKRFGFVDNKGRNPDFQTRESMIRRPKDYEAANTPEQHEQILRDAVVEHLRSKGIDVSTDWKLGQKILDEHNGQFSVDEGEETGIKPQKVTDQNTLDELNNGKTVKRYRAMQLIDGKLYPPMSAKVEGEMRQPTEIGVWEQAEERPDLIKNGKFVLNKGQKGQGNVPAAYNPYFHTSTSGLNDQFTSAYKRPELVVVEVEIPESELASGYKAEGAKDAVGNVDWHSGVVNGQLPADRQRQVTLSRYSKVNRIVPDSEVADMIAKQLEGTNVEVPYNVVTPQLRKALEERGVKISDKPAGSVTEDINGNPIRQQKVEQGINDLLKAEEFIEESLKGNKPGKRFEVNLPTITQRKVRRAMGRDFDSHNIFANGIVHSKNNHGENGDKLDENSIPLRDQDFKLAPHIMVAPDRVLKGSMGPDGRESIRFEKDLSNGVVLVVEKEQKSSPDDMDTITMWATKSSGGADARSKERPLQSTSQPANVAHEANAVRADARTVISDIDAAKIRKDSETAIGNDEKISYFKTPDGHAYGYTYQGKIYVDPRIATAETPVHEYGHLWCEMKRETSPEEWNDIKQVMLHDSMVQPIIEKVRAEYPELSREGREDDFVEEIITQFSGKRGNERLHEIAEEIAKEKGGVFGKAEAVTAMSRLKSILNRFWAGVAKMMGWKYTSASQIADRIMADMLNGLNLRESAKNDARYQLAGTKDATESEIMEAVSRDISPKEIEQAMNSRLVKQWLSSGKGVDSSKQSAFNLFGAGTDYLRAMAKARLGITNKYHVSNYLFNNAVEGLESLMSFAKEKGLDPAVADKYDFKDSDTIKSMLDSDKPVYSDKEVEAILKVVPKAKEALEGMMQAFADENKILDEIDNLRNYDNGDAVTKAFAIFDIAERRLRDQYYGDERFYRPVTYTKKAGSDTWSTDTHYHPDYQPKEGEEVQTRYLLKSSVANDLLSRIATAPINSRNAGLPKFQKVAPNGRAYLNPRTDVPKVRGGWNERKIKEFLKHHPTRSGIRTAARAISEFDSPEELKEHMFYHGTAWGSEHLKPSITMSDRDLDRYGGGGYGDKYWGVSVSKDKKIASRFSSDRNVRIYPIVLLKGANVIERPDFSDAYDAGEHIVDLWNDGVDAVWIGEGKQGKGEQELLILNPRAVVNIGTPDFYQQYKLGLPENPLRIADDKAINRMYETARQFMEYQLPTKPVKPSRLVFENGDFRRDEAGDLFFKSDAEYESDLEDYNKRMDEYNNSDEKSRYEEMEKQAYRDIRFQKVPDTAQLDKEYADAVAAGDKEKVDAMLREEADRKGYSEDSEYQGSKAFNGTAPSKNAYFETREERKQALEDGDFEGEFSLGDFVEAGIDANDLGWQLSNPRAATAGDKASLESIQNINNAIRSKSGKITMYRAVDADIKENSFRNGDWVTPSRKYAMQHIDLQDWKKGRIIEQEVPIDDIWWNGDDINEWGYDDGKTYAYKNTKNNRKLMEPTYDAEGNLIPLSQRFDSRKNEIMFQMVGKQGAAEADRTEGAGDRMETLRMAEESEKAGKDAKAIKLATGWERGADGQWRYEIPDADVDVIRAAARLEKANKNRRNELYKKYNSISDKWERLAHSIPDRLDGRYTEAQKAKYRQMRNERDELFREMEKARDEFYDYKSDMTTTLGDILGENNDVFKYYPDLKDTPVSFEYSLAAAGSYSKSSGIKLNIKEMNRFDSDELNNEHIYGVLLHEVQHAIQDIEGFATGGNLSTSTTEEGINAIIEKKERQRADIKARLDANNHILYSPAEDLKEYAELEGKPVEKMKEELQATVEQQAAEYDNLGLQIEALRHTKTPNMSDAKDLYLRLAGEVESRNVAGRKDMTGEQRRQSLAEDTEDVPRNDQVVIYDNAEAASLESPPEAEMTPEERQYWKQWDAAMKKWKERNAIPEDQTAAPEKPRYQQGETALEYAERLFQWTRQNKLWQTAPKLEDYRQVREDKDLVEDAREQELRYPDSPSARMRRAAAELLRIRHAVSRQKAYDKATVKAVTDFAQDFMKLGFGDNLGRGELERVLSSVKNATGAKDIKKAVDNVMNILIDNQLRNLDQRIVKLSSVKELSKTAQGVEKQGRLELKGQRMIQAFREARENRLTVDQLRARMAEVAEKMNRNDEEAPMWEQEYEGLAIALQYAENIEGSRSEWADLDREYKDAVKGYKTSGRSYKDQQQLLESIEQAMQENKIDRIGYFGDIIGRLEGNISESMQGAKEFVERDKERVKHIYSLVNFDLAGKESRTARREDRMDRVLKNDMLQLAFSPLATFEQMLKQFGARNVKGEGNLYNYFMRNYIDSINNAYTGTVKAREELDAKAKEIFGDKVKHWKDLYEITSKPGMDISYLDGDKEVTDKLSQGNMLYIYMANKMSDGKMKLRKMGITEEDVDAIKEALDPRLVQLGDWLQSEYLPQKRTDYNKVHERMFGAPMAAIDNYFPIKVNRDAAFQDANKYVTSEEGDKLPSAITGSIIKRTRNALPLDILHTDALSLAMEHLEEMEQWKAQAEFNRDVKDLLSNTTFRNKVKNMKTIYGSGTPLWNKFFDAATIATGDYSPKRGIADKTITNIAKGVTAAKINFRPYTAFKQLLSLPAFFHDVNTGDMAKAMLPQNYFRNNFKWAMENIPVFKKRWESRQIGDTRLMDDPSDWKIWKNKWMHVIQRGGMWANAAIDALTCAAGAKAIYDTRYKKYKDIGASDEVARKRALQDAAIGYNLTQQSNEGAFTSAIQRDRTVAANALSVFRNSSMSYTRQAFDAMRNLNKMSQKGYKEDAIDAMTHQFEHDLALDEDQARKAAEMEYAKAGRHEVAKMLNMMFGVTTLWNLGASLPYLIFGDDDETRKEMLTDALTKSIAAGPVEGLAGGNIWSDLIGRALSEETRKAFREGGIGSAFESGLKQAGDYEVNPLPLMADLQSMIKKMGYDKYAAAQDLFNIAAQSYTGVNPQTITDIWNAAMDYGNPSWMPFTDSSKGNDDLANPKEIALFIMRVLNAPTSSWRNKYIDELGMNAEDAKKLPYEEMAKRYANYKHWKDAPLMGWLRSDEARQKKMESIQKQFDKAVEERMQRLTDDELMRNVARSESAEEKRRYAKMIAQRLGVTPGDDSKKATSEKEWYQNLYQQKMSYEDIREDEILADKYKNLENYFKEKHEEAERKSVQDLKEFNEANKEWKDRIDEAKKEVKKRMDWIRGGKWSTPSGKKGNSKDATLQAPGKKQLETSDNPDEIMKNIRQWRKEALEMLVRAEK